MHEICHGLGFVGFCNVDNGNQTGTYTAADTLVPLINQALQGTAVQIPAHFNLGDDPVTLNSGFQYITPFAAHFQYTNNNLQKGVSANDYTAFTNLDNINFVRNNVPIADVLTGNPFVHFTTCDHIAGNGFLMSSTTEGSYFQAPDDSSLLILEAIGWTLA